EQTGCSSPERPTATAAPRTRARCLRAEANPTAAPPGCSSSRGLWLLLQRGERRILCGRAVAAGKALRGGAEPLHRGHQRGLSRSGPVAELVAARAPEIDDPAQPGVRDVSDQHALGVRIVDPEDL